jgi:hypothetical protein
VFDKDLRVIAASRSFYSVFKVSSLDTQGRLLYELGDGQWDIPKLRVLLEKIIPEQIKSFCGACRRRNSVGLTRGVGHRRFGWIWNFQFDPGLVAIKVRPRQVRNEGWRRILSAWWLGNEGRLSVY